MPFQLASTYQPRGDGDFEGSGIRKREYNESMTREVEAVYEKGMLRPLEPLPLAEHQHVKVTVSEMLGDPLASMTDRNFQEEARQAVAAAGHIPTHEEVRRMTAQDLGCWSEAILAERQERL